MPVRPEITRRRPSARRAAGIRSSLTVVVALLVAAPVLAQGTQEAAQPPRARVEYKDGFRITSGDERFSLRLTAGLQLRYTFTERLY